MLPYYLVWIGHLKLKKQKHLRLSYNIIPRYIKDDRGIYILQHSMLLQRVSPRI